MQHQRTTHEAQPRLVTSKDTFERRKPGLNHWCIRNRPTESNQPSGQRFLLAGPQPIALRTRFLRHHGVIPSCSRSPSTEIQKMTKIRWVKHAMKNCPEWDLRRHFTWQDGPTSFKQPFLDFYETLCCCWHNTRLSAKPLAP